MSKDQHRCYVCDDDFTARGHYFTDLALPGRFCSWKCLTIAKDTARTGFYYAPRRANPVTMQLHKLPAGAGG